MLYYDFKNYEEFKEIFTIVEHGNGVKSRRNKILLALYKDRSALRNYIRYKEFISIKDEKERIIERKNKMDTEYASTCKVSHFDRATAIIKNLRKRQASTPINISMYDLLSYQFLPVLKGRLYRIMGTASLLSQNTGKTEVLSLMGRAFFSDQFRTDDMKGLCEDGTLNAIRYVNIERNHVFKMKAGKMFNHLMAFNPITRDLPYEIQRWLSEEFVSEWLSYAENAIGNNGQYTLHVDDNFARIYDRDECMGYDQDDDSFGSCMVDDKQYSFYEDSVYAKAAYLTNEDDKVVARCILFPQVYDEDGNVWRLAERQYSCGSDESLKRKLICELIKGGYIDGYKRLTAACCESRDFVDINGNSLSNKIFYISCSLNPDDTLSYQDSFKYYDPESGKAYNTDNLLDDYVDLATTDSSLCGAYCRHRGEYYFDNYIVFTHDCNYEHKDDCIRIGEKYYYAGIDCSDPEGNGILTCPSCGEKFYVDDGYYSDITGATYCSHRCLNDEEDDYKRDNWYWSEYDEAFFEDEDEILTAYEFNAWSCRWDKITIHVSSFNRLVTCNNATEFCGEYFIDEVNFEGEPINIGSFVREAV